MATAALFLADAPAHAIGELSYAKWHRENPPTSPGSPSFEEPLAYYPDAGNVVLFRGASAETWTWNGTTWAQQTPAHSPPAVHSPELAYDATTNRMLLFIGEQWWQNASGAFESETWAWDGSDWTRLNPVHTPPPRRETTMSRGPGGTVVLYGGTLSTQSLPTADSYPNDTWVWDGSDWTEVTPAVGPVMNGRSALAYDEANDEVVLFGGYGEFTESFGRNETWTWDGTRWVERSPAHVPPKRFSTSMDNAGALGVVLVGGDQTYDCDTWAWDGTDWTELDAWPERCDRDGVVVNDAARGELLLRTDSNATWTMKTADPWHSLGGQILGAPGASTWGPGRLDVVARGTDNQIWHKWHDGRWFGWEGLGGVTKDEPAAASWGPGRYDVFVRGTDNALWHRWYDGRWFHWESLGGVLTSGPAVVAWGHNRLDVFVRGSDQAMWHKWWDGRAWSHWESLGGVLTSKPVAVTAGPWTLDVYARGTDNEIWNRWYDPYGGWADWESWLGGGPWDGPPAVAYFNDSRLDFFAPDDGVFWQTTTDDYQWIPLGNKATSAPAAVSWGTGRMDLFARGTGGELTHTSTG